jgi:hypothetical protein
MKVPSVEVKADRNVFSVTVDNPEITGLWGSTYEFAIHADGDIVINDNTFSSREAAITVLKSIATFLENQGKKK